MEITFLSFSLVAVALFVIVMAVIIVYRNNFKEREAVNSDERFLVETTNQEDHERETTNYEEGKVVVEGIIKFDFDETTQKFTVNGMPNPPMNFLAKTGTTNFYEIENVSDHPLYFGYSESGSEDMSDAINLYKGKPRSLENGSIFINFDDNVPSNFYYHSPLVEGAGNKIQSIRTV